MGFKVANLSKNRSQGILVRSAIAIAESRYNELPIYARYTRDLGQPAIMKKKEKRKNTTDKRSRCRNYRCVFTRAYGRSRKLYHQIDLLPR